MNNRRNSSIIYNNNFAKQLYDLPEIKSIESLNISHALRYKMTQQHSDMLAYIFPSMSSIKKFSLTKVNLENPDALATAISTNKTLQSLEIGTLGSNGLTKVLRAILASPAPIRSLSLPNCIITNAAARNALYRLIRHHKTLREIKITGCTFDKVDKTISIVRKALQKNITLTEFIFDAPLSTEDKEEFSSVLERNQELLAKRSATAQNPNRLFAPVKLQLPVIKAAECKQKNGCKFN